MSVLAHNNKIIITPNRKALLPPQSGPIIPDGFTKIEYLSATGTQFVDTGIIGTENTDYKVKFEFPDLGTSGNVAVPIFGDRTSSSENRKTILGYASGAGTSRSRALYVNEGTNLNEAAIPKDSSGIFVTLEKKGKKLFLNGSEFYEFSDIVYETPNTLLIGGFRTAGASPASYYAGKLYDCKVGGEEFITLKRNADGVAGFYNVTKKEFLISEGADPFTPGPDIISAEDLLNRLEAIL